MPGEAHLKATSFDEKSVLGEGDLFKVTQLVRDGARSRPHMSRSVLFPSPILRFKDQGVFEIKGNCLQWENIWNLDKQKSRRNILNRRYILCNS